MRLQAVLWACALFGSGVSGCSLDEVDMVHNAAMMQYKHLQPISDEQADATFEYVKASNNHYVYFQIYKGELYTYVKPGLHGYRIEKVTCLLHSLLLNEENEIPDTSFVINTHDGSVQKVSDNYATSVDKQWSTWWEDTMQKTHPIFSFSRDRLMQNASHALLFPDDYSIGSGDPNDFYMMGLGAGWKNIREADKKPYLEKKKEIMWRGKNTGAQCYFEYQRVEFWPECLYTPKMTCVNLSREVDFLDCKFAAQNGVISVTDRHWGTTEANLINLKGKADYQKLLVIDGFRATFPGFALSLMYNAVTLKVEGSNTKAKPQNVWEQWFHSQLVPYVHFYPIDALNMNASLHAAYAYLEANPDIAEEMSRRSSEFAKEMLSPCAVEKYVALLLKGYEARAKMGSRPPREGMTKLSQGNLNYCHARYNNHVRHGLYTEHGTLASNVRKPKPPTTPAPTAVEVKPEGAVIDAGSMQAAVEAVAAVTTDQPAPTIVEVKEVAETVMPNKASSEPCNSATLQNGVYAYLDLFKVAFIAAVIVLTGARLFPQRVRNGNHLPSPRAH